MTGTPATPTQRKARRKRLAIRIEAEGYRGANARPGCARCNAVSLKPYTNGNGGKVFHCGIHKAYVAAYGICPEYTGPTAFDINPKGLDPCPHSPTLDFPTTTPTTKTSPISAQAVMVPGKASTTEPPAPPAGEAG